MGKVDDGGELVVESVIGSRSCTLVGRSKHCSNELVCFEYHCAFAIEVG